MKTLKPLVLITALSMSAFMLSSCTTYTGSSHNTRPVNSRIPENVASYDSRLPSHVSSNDKMILIDPNVHAWGAYQNGNLVKAGLAVAGADYCPDIGRRCHTGVGSFRVQSLGAPGCKSTIYPRPRGGAPMPYCMFFNKNQAMHGEYEGGLAEANLSHGCVRMHTPDAEWLRYNFVNVGTKVVVRPY
jgi:hypothetical protein